MIETSIFKKSGKEPGSIPLGFILFLFPSPFNVLPAINDTKEEYTFQE